MIDEVKKFLASTTLAPRTRELYLEHLTWMYAWLVERDIKPRSLTADQLLEFLDDHNWSDSTRNSAVCAARVFWRWKYGPKHQVCSVRVQRADPGPQRTLKRKQVEQLVEGLDTQSLKGTRDLALVMLMLDTGLRASEVCSLTLDHLDMEDWTLSVRVKGGKWKPGAFFDYTASCLGAWLSMRAKIARPGVETVFVSIGGTKPGCSLTRDGLRAIFRALGIKSGVGLISPHDLRRTFATIATSTGAPTRVVQLGGRWQNIDLVERYTRALEVKAMRPYSPANAVMGIQPDGDVGEKS